MDEDGIRKALDAGVKLLAVKDRSRQELRERLLARGFGPQEVDGAESRLVELGLLDDRRLALDLARKAAEERGLARGALREALAGAGLPRDLVEEAASGVEGRAGERIMEVAARRFTQYRHLPQKTARRRLFAYLVRHGFDEDEASSACGRVLAQESRPN